MAVGDDIKTKGQGPPPLAARLLRWVSRPDSRYSILGDYEELYHAIVLERGLPAARNWYWSQVVKSLPVFITNQIFWSLTMIRNTIKIALRNIRKSKGYSLVNILGLAFDGFMRKRYLYALTGKKREIFPLRNNPGAAFMFKSKIVPLKPAQEFLRQFQAAKACFSFAALLS